MSVSRRRKPGGAETKAGNPSRLVKRESFSSADEDGEKTTDDESTLKALPPKEPVSAKKVLTRTATALVMLASYLGLLYMGHLYIILTMIVVQVECYRELVNIRYVEAKERAMPWFRTIQWAWFFLAMLHEYGETLHQFCLEHKSMYFLTPFTSHNYPVAYVLSCFLSVCTVLTLKKGLVRFQISQFMWSAVTILIVVVQCKSFATHVLNGIFWFWFPMANVVMNDVTAYFAGITLGRKIFNVPFLSLSPNKTWEGFIGASIGTIIFSFFFPALLAPHSWIICPVDGLYFTIPPSLHCEPHPVFIKTLYNIPFLGEYALYPIQIHGLAFGVFASFVAPFGGFFASAIKRAYKKKDFDSFFPGHGGLMDRMDCQLMIVAFTSVYCFTLFKTEEFSLAKLLYHASKLGESQKIELIKELTRQI